MRRLDKDVSRPKALEEGTEQGWLKQRRAAVDDSLLEVASCEEGDVASTPPDLWTESHEKEFQKQRKKQTRHAVEALWDGRLLPAEITDDLKNAAEAQVAKNLAQDKLLRLKEDKSTFTDNVSFFPATDLSRPSIIHQGLTLKHLTANVEPLEGLLFSNQFGAETDRDVAVFKNQTNYITMEGNKINCNATSDDSIASLRLNPAGHIEFSNVILPADGADLYRPSGNTSNNLRIRDLQGI